MVRFIFMYRVGAKVIEFTLEELEDIHLIYRTFCGDGRILTDLEQGILKKTKEMIDNYCDHEWENICCQCTLDKIYCHKCEKDMGELKERYND